MNENHFPRIDDKLRLFILHVEEGKTPPEWLLRFMADGAREFQRGGKPWQKKDGRKPVRDFQRFADAFVLSEHGKLTADEIVLLRGDGDAQGTDKTKTVERDIKKGSVLHGSIEFWWFYFHQSLIRWAASDLSEIAPSRAKECRAALKVELARIKRDEQEPGYD